MKPKIPENPVIDILQQDLQENVRAATLLDNASKDKTKSL